MVQQKILTLVLSSCGLDDTCTKELAKGLRGYSPLTSLDLSKNYWMSSKFVIIILKEGDLFDCVAALIPDHVTPYVITARGAAGGRNGDDYRT